MPDKYYLTTPLYYVNAKPHIGHSYTNIAADALARFKRLQGKEVLFLTGTDEHGQKVERASREAGMSPGGFTDSIVPSFKDLWQRLSISYDDFIRTTEKRHVETVKAVWLRLHEKGEIYKDRYSGYYCTPCETFWTERQVLTEKEGILCPDCRRPLDQIEEENFFFRISRHQKWLMDTVRSGEMLVLPETRQNEVLGFLENNVLQDLCISRPKSRLSWGIESPVSPEHVTYVWFDALINYISACGYPDDENKFRKWWPVDVHLVGKDILRHHAIYWPILLKVLDLKLPRMIFAHGWWVQGREKMSKSRGNVVDPLEIVGRFGVDAYRYFLLREIPFGSDGVFSEEALTQRFNHDLANDLGNLAHRTLTMCEKYFGGRVPEGVSLDCAGPLRREAEGLFASLDLYMAKLDFSQALAEIWKLINRANKFIEESTPWKLAKQADLLPLKKVLVELLEVLRTAAHSLSPFMPATAEALWTQLGMEASPAQTPFAHRGWGSFQKGGKIQKAAPLFPRIEK
ncbi:MAG: methionine--tRNA ligase [Candidatus Omnitrophica bacterium]|nr:methionine--tRNA ligase [Candidatus Omnitrophota bacterium]